MLNLHQAPSEFMAAIQYTFSKLGFRSELIEKDYFCSLILEYLSTIEDNQLIFKGGTMLTKVYNDFFRLSEDLDFTIPITISAKRNERKEAIKPVKDLYKSFERKVPGLYIGSGLMGSNESKQYIGELCYNSVITKGIGKIRFEVSVREPLIDSTLLCEVKTILLNPFTEIAYSPKITLRCFSKFEAYAEKVRAALCRLQPAIRDFFDLDHAIQNGTINLGNKKFRDQVFSKIKVPETNSIDLSETKLNMLRMQIQSELFPTLRAGDYDKFQLDRVYKQLEQFVSYIQI